MKHLGMNASQRRIARQIYQLRKVVKRGTDELCKSLNKAKLRQLEAQLRTDQMHYKKTVFKTKKNKVRR